MLKSFNPNGSSTWVPHIYNTVLNSMQNLIGLKISIHIMFRLCTTNKILFFPYRLQ